MAKLSDPETSSQRCWVSRGLQERGLACAGDPDKVPLRLKWDVKDARVLHSGEPPPPQGFSTGDAFTPGRSESGKTFNFQGLTM